MPISAKILTDSIHNNIRITTFELEYPRFIHSEFMTHRQFSRNAASSRAIPIQKTIDLVLEAPATPAYWGLNQPGMQASDEHADPEYCRIKWYEARSAAVKSAIALKDINLHKQIVNRVLEPFQNIKVVVTATEYDNFFHLRSHPDAQPEIKVLSDAMYQARANSVPFPLQPGEYHLPYIHTVRDGDEVSYLNPLDSSLLTLEQALAISASACAQVSYRVLDLSIDKAMIIYQRLVESKPVHASPFEHQATPIPDDAYPLPEGVTHIDRYGQPWSANFKGWIQHRQLIPGNVCHDYKG